MGNRWLERLAGPRRAHVVGSFALLLALPSVSMDPVLDDHGLRRRLWVEGRGPNAAFELAQEPGWLGRHGPWWFDPAPARRFLRPLSGTTHWLDFRLWPDAVWWMRLEGCVLYALLAALAARCYERLHLPVWAAVVAAWMFAADDAHAQSLAMIAARNTLLSAALGLCGLLTHHAHATAPTPARKLAGPCTFALALLAGEGGLSTLAYLVAYAGYLDRRAVAARVRSLLPYAVVTSVWAAVYVHGGYGAADGRFYRDPIRDPLGTLANGVLDLPIWMASQLTVGFATPSLELAPALVRLAAGAILLPIALLSWPAVRSMPSARFCAAGALLSLVPLMTTLPQDRLLVTTSFGAFGLLACALESARSRARRAARFGLLAIHLGLAPLAFVPTYLLAGRIAHAEAKVEAALPKDDRGVVIVRAPIIGTLAYALAARASHGSPLPRYGYELYAAPSALSVSRVDARTLELVPDGGYCQSRAECIGTRAPLGFRMGQHIPLAGVQVEIRELTDRGAPLRVRFTFPSALEDATRRWLTWTKQGVRPFDLPAIGETRTLPALSALDAFR